jgi:hypothetical protein
MKQMGERTGVMCGWSEDQSRVEEVMKFTHDQLIVSMGARRCGGVKWMVQEGSVALMSLDTLREGASSEFLARVIDPIQDRLKEAGGFLVVAMADGEGDIEG